jgi:hypothetical protein
VLGGGGFVVGPDTTPLVIAGGGAVEPLEALAVAKSACRAGAGGVNFLGGGGGGVGGGGSFDAGTDQILVAGIQTGDGEVVINLVSPAFAGTRGKANCHGKSVSALAQQYGGLNNAAAALGYSTVDALQNAIMEFCEG